MEHLEELLGKGLFRLSGAGGGKEGVAKIEEEPNRTSNVGAGSLSRTHYLPGQDELDQNQYSEE